MNNSDTDMIDKDIDRTDKVNIMPYPSTIGVNVEKLAPSSVVDDTVERDVQKLLASIGFSTKKVGKSRVRTPDYRDGDL